MKAQYKSLKGGRKKKKSVSSPIYYSPPFPLGEASVSHHSAGLSQHFPPTPEKERSWYSSSEDVHNPRSLGHLISKESHLVPFPNAWTDNRWEQVKHFKLWAYVCINKIARKVASQYPNISCLKEVLTSSDKNLRTLQKRKALAPLLTHEHLRPVSSKHPLYKLFRDPNEPDTADDLWYETILYLYLTGSAYWWLPTDPFTGVPAAVWVVPSHWMWPCLNEEGEEGYDIRPTEGQFMTRFVPKSEIVWFPFKNPISKLDGFSPMTAVAPWLDVSESIAIAQLASYKQGTFPSVVIQFNGDLNDPTEEILRRIEAKFLARYQGEMRANKPLFLPPGVTAKPFQIKAAEMLFGENARETRDNICAAFGVPLGLVDLKGDTLKDEASFYSQTINPLCHWLGSILTEKVASRYPQDDGKLRVWWEAFSADDPKMINENHKVSLLCMALTPNERRISQGQEPIDDPYYDQPIRPVNMEPGSLPGGGDHMTDIDQEISDTEQPEINEDE